MLGGLVAALIAVGLVVALILVPGSKQHRPIVGFNDNAVTQGVATPDQTARLISAAGAHIDRVQIDWAGLEPRSGRFAFSQYDATYRADLAHGVRPIFIFAFAPTWATDGTCDSSTAHCPPARDHYVDAARATAAIAKRYPKLAGIEIWNEPNTPYFWAPRADPAAYTALLRACHRAINRADPAMPVAGGSMSSSQASGGGLISAPDFLRGIYENGGKGAMDAISLHAYPDPADVTARSALGVLEEVRRVRDQSGDGATPLWVTETGISTTGRDAVPDRVQALVLLRLYDELRTQSGVEMVLFHTLVQPPGVTDDPETGYGIVGRGLQLKPAYCTLSAAWGGRLC